MGLYVSFENVVSYSPSAACLYIYLRAYFEMFGTMEKCTRIKLRNEGGERRPP